MYEPLRNARVWRQDCRIPKSHGASHVSDGKFAKFYLVWLHEPLIGGCHQSILSGKLAISPSASWARTDQCGKLERSECLFAHSRVSFQVSRLKIVSTAWPKLARRLRFAPATLCSRNCDFSGHLTRGHPPWKEYSGILHRTHPL